MKTRSLCSQLSPSPWNESPPIAKSRFLTGQAEQRKWHVWRFMNELRKHWMRHTYGSRFWLDFFIFFFERKPSPVPSLYGTGYHHDKNKKRLAILSLKRLYFKHSQFLISPSIVLSIIRIFLYFWTVPCFTWFNFRSSYLRFWKWPGRGLHFSPMIRIRYRSSVFRVKHFPGHGPRFSSLDRFRFRSPSLRSGLF